MLQPHEHIGVLSKLIGQVRKLFPCLLLVSGTLLMPYLSKAQAKISYDIFSKSPLGGIKIENTILANIEAITNTDKLLQSSTANHPFTIYDHDRLAAELEYQQAQMKMEIQNANRSFGSEEEDEINHLRETQSYQQAFRELLHMNPDRFSITKALYLVESAYTDNDKDRVSYAQFSKAITQLGVTVKQGLKREGLSDRNNLALNYGIQKLFSKESTYYDSKSKQTYTVAPFKYDFDDYRGEKDYTKMFVTKALKTGTGQCHSLPLLYLAVAESLNAKAWLSLAPQHSFIQFPDNQNRLVNFETTNGNIVSPTWLTQSGFVNAMALKNKTYLDTMPQKKLYAQMLGDLLLGYIHKFGYDRFAEQMRQHVLAVNPDNLTAKIVEAQIKTQIALRKINEAGKPKEEDLPKYPDAYKAYLAMQAAYAAVDNIGYQDMPKEQYQQWLKSIDREKKSQKNRELQATMQKEIQRLKNLKNTFRNYNSKQ